MRRAISVVGVALSAGACVWGVALVAGDAHGQSSSVPTNSGSASIGTRCPPPVGYLRCRHIQTQRPGPVASMTIGGVVTGTPQVARRIEVQGICQYFPPHLPCPDPGKVTLTTTVEDRVDWLVSGSVSVGVRTGLAVGLVGRLHADTSFVLQASGGQTLTTTTSVEQSLLLCYNTVFEEWFRVDEVSGEVCEWASQSEYYCKRFDLYTDWRTVRYNLQTSPGRATRVVALSYTQTNTPCCNLALYNPPCCGCGVTP